MIWPFAILLELLSVFLLRFAMASKGKTCYAHMFGVVLSLVAAFWSWRLFGLAPWFTFVIFFLLVVLPIVEIVLARTLNKTDKYWV